MKFVLASWRKFPDISTEKLNAGIFNDHQISHKTSLPSQPLGSLSRTPCWLKWRTGGGYFKFCTEFLPKNSKINSPSPKCLLGCYRHISRQDYIRKIHWYSLKADTVISFSTILAFWRRRTFSYDEYTHTIECSRNHGQVNLASPQLFGINLVHVFQW